MLCQLRWLLTYHFKTSVCKLSILSKLYIMFLSMLCEYTCLQAIRACGLHEWYWEKEVRAWTIYKEMERGPHEATPKWLGHNGTAEQAPPTHTQSRCCNVHTSHHSNSHTFRVCICMYANTKVIIITPSTVCPLLYPTANGTKYLPLPRRVWSLAWSATTTTWILSNYAHLPLSGGARPFAYVEGSGERRIP